MIVCQKYNCGFKIVVPIVICSTFAANKVLVLDIYIVYYL